MRGYIRAKLERLVSSYILLFFSYIFIQTLTTLKLSMNQIGAEGAQHLGEALKQNKVNILLSSTLSSLSFIFHTDTHHTPTH
jgi:hypothetical protein